jgi:hypothetical protein
MLDLRRASVGTFADPLDDLAALRTISLVVQGGRVIREDTL